MTKNKQHCIVLTGLFSEIYISVFYLGEDGSDITVEVSGEENLDLSLNSNLEFLESEEGHHHAHHNICT